MSASISPVSRAQAAKLVVELERAADALVDELETPGIHVSSVVRRRHELVEVRRYIQRLQDRYGLGAVSALPREEPGSGRP